MGEGASFKASLDQWELLITTRRDGLRISVTDGPDQAGVDLPIPTALDLLTFLEAWRDGHLG